MIHLRCIRKEKIHHSWPIHSSHYYPTHFSHDNNNNKTIKIKPRKTWQIKRQPCLYAHPVSECNHRIRATVFPFVSGSKIGAKNVFGSVGFFHKQKGRGRGEKEKRENAALSNASTINLVSTANAITRPSPRTSIVNVAPHVPPLPLPSSPPP